MLTPSVTGECVKTTKRVLRSNAKFTRGRISPAERKHAADCLVSHASTLSQLTNVPSDGVVATYYPMGGEINPLLLVDWLRQIGWKIALPTVIEPHTPLVFRQWDEGAHLHTGVHGIQQPPDDAAVCVPDVILIPLLAFDAKGRRLGYGGGYYDRTLEELEKAGHEAVTIGLSFALQEVVNVPNESWDHCLDMFLTERGVLDVENVS